jgi:hypothetical protein
MILCPRNFEVLFKKIKLNEKKKKLRGAELQRKINYVQNEISKFNWFFLFCKITVVGIN